MIHRSLAITLALALLSLSFPASAAMDGLTVADTKLTFEGLITEVNDGYFLFNALNEGMVRANLVDTTVFEGTAKKDNLAMGQYVYVQYNSVMTRSLPPQITAQKVSCYEVQGTVTSLLDNGFVLEGDAVLGKVIVHSDPSLAPVFLNVPITLYYNGIMSMSMPPQISAVHLSVPMLEGTISDSTADGFTLTQDNGTAFTVTLSPDTALNLQPSDGERTVVYYNGQISNGADVDALAVEPLITVDNATETTKN